MSAPHDRHTRSLAGHVRRYKSGIEWLHVSQVAVQELMVAVNPSGSTWVVELDVQRHSVTPTTPDLNSWLCRLFQMFPNDILSAFLGLPWVVPIAGNAGGVHIFSVRCTCAPHQSIRPPRFSPSSIRKNCMFAQDVVLGRRRQWEAARGVPEPNAQQIICQRFIVSFTNYIHVYDPN